MDEIYALPESGLEALSVEDLVAQETAALESFNALAASDDLTDEAITNLEGVANAIESIRTTLTAKREHAVTAADRRAAALARVTPVAEVEVPEPVVAAVEPTPAPKRTIVRPVVDVTVPEAPAQRVSIIAAADIPHIPSGSLLDLDGLAEASYQKARMIKSASGRFPLATIEKPIQDLYDLRSLSQSETRKRIQDVASENHFNSLVAAGGWCAPSEILYDFFDLECAQGQVLRLPTFRANRGGVEWPISTPLPALPVSLFPTPPGAGSTDWVWTEADDISALDGDPTKPCIRIPCPAFDNCRLDAHGVCITVGNLMDRAYPENVRRYISQVYLAHERNENLRRISVLVAGSDAYFHEQVFGTGSSVISALLLRAQAYRDEFRMCDGAVLEVKAPIWIKPAIKADIAKQDFGGVGNAGLVSDATIRSWFAAAGLDVQFLHDWQQLVPGTTVWPNVVQFLLYAPGTWVEFSNGTLDLGLTRDSVLNSTNDFNYFSEEFYCIGFRGYKSEIVTVEICNDGAVGARVEVVCDGAS